MKSPIHVLLEAALKNAAHQRRRGFRKLFPVRHAIQNAHDDIRDRVGGERRTPREHFVKDASERPDVRSFVDGFAARLLRTHIRGRADDFTATSSGDGECYRAFVVGAACCVGCDDFGETEIEHLDPAVAGYLDVRGF